MSQSHLSDKTKICTKCGETKGEDSFRQEKSKEGKIWIRKICKSCYYEHHVKSWRANNPERHKEQSAETYRRRREAFYKKHREWVAKNMELRRAMNRESYYRSTRGKGTTLTNDSGVGYARRKTINKDRSYVEEDD